MVPTTPTARRPRPTRRLSVLALRGAALAIIPIGLRFLIRPDAAQAGFGLPAAPGDPYLAVKGIRDIASGLVLLTVLAHGDRRLAGRAALAAATTPVGDMLVVLRWGGRPGIALGVHGATALVMAAAAAPLLLQHDTEPLGGPHPRPLGVDPAVGRR